VDKDLSSEQYLQEKLAGRLRRIEIFEDFEPVIIPDNFKGRIQIMPSKYREENYEEWVHRQKENERRCSAL
jgi:hypothetical protein